MGAQMTTQQAAHVADLKSKLVRLRSELAELYSYHTQDARGNERTPRDWRQLMPAVRAAQRRPENAHRWDNQYRLPMPK